MQKLFSFLALSLILLQFPESSKLSGSSAPTSIFQDDLSNWDCEMSALTELEQLVQARNTTLTELQSANHPLVQQVLPIDNAASILFGSSAPEHERLLGIPGFLWGFCCSVVGLFLVYIALDDPASKKKEGRNAIIGCAVGTCIWVGTYAWLMIWLQFYG